MTINSLRAQSLTLAPIATSVQTGVRKHRGGVPWTKAGAEITCDDPSAMISAASPAYGEEQVSWRIG